jgi:hypothetical protein
MVSTLLYLVLSNRMLQLVLYHIVFDKSNIIVMLREIKILRYFSFKLIVYNELKEKLKLQCKSL